MLPVPHDRRPGRRREQGAAVADRAIGYGSTRHGPGRNHLAAVAAEFPDRAIAKARSKGRGRRACCRRPVLTPGDPDVAAADPTTASPRGIDKDRARFQGMTLRPTTAARRPARLDCLHLHDPHTDAVTDHSVLRVKY
ncbi:MAG: hypothetical protein U0835_18660 [Isosphaeraceae bacterium]